MRSDRKGAKSLFRIHSKLRTDHKNSAPEINKFDSILSILIFISSIASF